jgi:hypothetical protein
MNAALKTEFQTKYHGYLRNVLQWEGLATLWDKALQSKDNQWYIYAVGEPLPEKKASRVELQQFVTAMDKLLKEEHHHDYCGIVYTDSFEEPSLIKIYDPNNLGSACGSGSHPPPFPGWILTKYKPEELKVTIVPGNRRRWWQNLF